VILVGSNGKLTVAHLLGWLRSDKQQRWPNTNMN